MKLFLVFLLFSFNIILANDKPEELFYKAGEHFSQGEFRQAATVYEQLLSDGYNSKSLYFNLGNCYFRLGNFGYAVLYYEKALKIDPNDKEVIHNLKLTNAQLADKIQAVPEFFVYKIWNNTAELTSSYSWYWLFILFLTIMLIAIVMFKYSKMISVKKILFPVIPALATLTILSLSLSFYKSGLENATNQAVITANSVRVMNAANQDATPLFTIHEGVKVSILNYDAGSVQVLLPDGRSGWVAEKSITII